ncbi:PEP/pyruvate-binding domain-containing protein [Dictyobacter aurantiacus]|uniref:Phosphoenolpyruvate synthase n=1 Tax=Dictyobacter aurantiacus TaxID=1936993 RepID=A0A401ZLF6_9CHLR|nr:PEP/pyruvate-binding domain-containing protein [Dictyobacter aurantiacus]GCE07707.1 phosphoenolpyruvate synthase [Dictyobacter aurantiacus]
MSRQSQAFPSNDRSQPDADVLVAPLETLDRTTLPLAGGKAANLGELIQAGLRVPAGFCVTTTAYERIAAHAGLHTQLLELASVSREGRAERLVELAIAIRTALRETSLPPEVVEAITKSYQALSDGSPIPVAVRSSATTEDLPDASFAGQQETFLNVIGIDAVLSAVHQCFVSLWTDRAIAYRASLGIGPQSVRLAVVVQRMVVPEVAGVLFTANPLTGKRREAVIEANPNLGEAVVSGITNPDHVVVRTRTGEIIERRLGEKQVVIQANASGGTRTIEARSSHPHFCLSDEQIHTLSALGARVEALYGTPQDIEWALDAAGSIFLLQARPITTLFPLPAGAPSSDEELRVYLAFGVQQGTYRPFTPLGTSSWRLLTSGLLTLIGHPPADPLSGPSFVQEAASRPFFEVTAALRSAFGRRFLIESMREAEVHAATSFEQLTTDPRLSLRRVRRLAVARALLLLFARTHLPWYLLQALIAPRVATRRVQRDISQLRSGFQLDPDAPARAHLAEAERLLLESTRVAFRVSPVMLAGMQSFVLARRLLGDLASESECQRVLGGSPANPTTQMNLALWKLSELLQADESSLHLLTTAPPAHLAQDYQLGQLPALLQEGMTHFLQEYGHQSICDLDLGMPRWSEDPTYVFDLLTGYLQLPESAHTPDLQLQRAGDAASAMIETLSQRTKRQHWLRGWLVRLLLIRAHALAGFREMTRFVLGLRLAQARSLLLPVGEALRQAGRLGKAADVFFLTFPEIHAALGGTDQRATVAARRTTFDRELKRRHIPLVLLSDGTEPALVRPSEREGAALRGTPASPGRVTAPARVILDPEAAQLAAGEILVAPSTDPGWTPLFLKAAGLVMEAGGAMAHGAIVAREYGLPAVVGVAGATERITTGSLLTLDGSAGIVTIESRE